MISTLRDALGLSVFLVTHDLDTLYTITDRVAVLAQKKVLVADAAQGHARIAAEPLSQTPVETFHTVAR